MNIFKRLKEGLSKTRQNIVAGFDNIFSGHKAINDDFYDELEEVMIMGDMGVRATDEILEELREKVKAAKIKDPEECRTLLIETIKEKIDLGENAYDYENQKSALLIIGVNGVGKTTSVGKLAASLSGKGRKVLLAAADTFRAGAIDQLKIWGERAGVPVIAQSEGADPGAVIYDAVQSAKAKDVDVLIADTAGRLHNKKNLMNELSKIDRIIEREYPDVYRENLIVLDATTGQNALMQLKEFKEVADITGIILTKMDGTAKGGIIVAIQAEYGIPVKYIGVGEKIQDLQKFNSDAFVNALFDVEIPDDDYYTSEVDDDEEYAQKEARIPSAYADDAMYGEEEYEEETVPSQGDIPSAYRDEEVYEEEPAGSDDFRAEAASGYSDDDDDMIDLDDFLGDDEDTDEGSTPEIPGSFGAAGNETAEPGGVPEHKEASFVDLENLGHGLSFEELYGEDNSGRDSGVPADHTAGNDHYEKNSTGGEDRYYDNDDENGRDRRFYDDDDDDRDGRFYDDDDDDRDGRFYDDDDDDDGRPRKKKGLFGLFRR